MRILVSGATGFVGKAITRHLLEAGHSVKAMSRSAAKARAIFEATDVGQAALAIERLTFVEADVTRPDTLPPAVREVDAVVQAAQFAGAPVEDPARGLTYMKVDRNGTLNLLGAIAQAYGAPTAAAAMARFPNGSPWFLYVSGVSVSADSPYTWDLAKWQAEEAIRGSGLDWTIVRSCWAFGPGDVALNRLIGYSDLLPFLPLFGNGEAPLTPIFVEDIGRFFADAIANRESCHDTTFSIGGPDRVTLNDFMRSALKAKNRKRPLLHVPRPLGKLQAGLLQHLPGRPLTPGAVDFVSQEGAVTEDDRALIAGRVPGWQPTHLKEALESYMGAGK